MNGETNGGWTRRDFVKSSAGFAAAAVASGIAVPLASAKPSRSKMDTLRVGLIGCGGRGTGAAVNSMEGSADTQIVAMADMFKERVAGSRRELSGMKEYADRVKVTDETCYTGFDAYKRLLDSKDIDVVILATPPGFRPTHFAAAIDAGKHVFFEKPVAVDPTGIRKVMAAAKKAEEKKLCVVTGTQRRHEKVYLEAMKKLKEGAIGTIVAAEVYWNQGPLWMNKREEGWSDMEWQLRNWLYFTWLSGDHIVEQHVHNLDVGNWVMGGHPTKATGLGGRQVRTDPAYGHIYDHFAVQYEYEGGKTVTSMCRQIDGCDNRVEEVVHGSEGKCVTSSGRAMIEGKVNWKFDGQNPNPYMVEHKDLVDAIRNGPYLNEGQRVAESTLTAIMGRMSAYSGKTLTWDQALNSSMDLMPPPEQLALGSIPTPPVAMPGKTPLPPPIKEGRVN